MVTQLNELWRIYESEFAAAKTYAEIFAPLVAMLRQAQTRDCFGRPRKYRYVAGAISERGGLGDRKLNCALYQDLAKLVANQGCLVIDMVLFDPHVKRLHAALGGDYPMGFLNDVCLPLLGTDLVGGVSMVPLWHKSLGATLEHDRAKQILCHTPGYVIQYHLPHEIRRRSIRRLVENMCAASA